MQQVQLYIGNQRIDMFKDESVSITDTIKDVKDISKIFTEYSQTFEIPASKINNKVFKHYYDNDIVGGFDARVRAPAFIELNSAPFKKGFIKLEGVDLKDNIAHTYRITFFGNTVSLKRLLGDDKLTDLRWLDNFNTRNSGADIRYVSSDIEDYLTAKHNKTFGGVTYDNPVQVPLVTHTERLYYNSAQNDDDTGNLHFNSSDNAVKKGVKWTELKYALKLTAIIDAIQAPIAEGGYGITFSDDFFNNSTNTAFNDLSMWLHRIRGQATSGGQEVSTTTQPTGWADAGGTFGTPSMISNIFASGIGSYTYSLQLAPSNNDTYSYQVFRETSSFVNGQPVNTPFTLIHSSGNVNGGNSFNIGAVTTITARFYIEITSTTQINFTSINWRASATGGNPSPDSNFTLTNYLKTVVFNLVMTQQLPKMKVLDFLTSIFNMFSLVAYFEDDILVVKTLTDFYAVGKGGSSSSETGYDITQYVDVKKKTVDVALPFREVKYSYSGLKTFLAAQHDQLFNEEWGTEEYKGEDSTILSEEIFKVTIPFEHLKFEKLIDVTTSAIKNILWGFFVDDSQRPYIGQPAIFNTVLLNADISFVYDVDFENKPLQQREITSYQAPCNSNMNSSTSLQPTINFAPEIDEYNFQQNNATLFKDFHKNYISGVFAESNRLTIVKAFLPLNILLKYNLNDRFIISGKSYKINSIETNLYTGQSDIELLKDVFPAYVAPEVVNFIAAENGDNLTAENGDFLITEQ